MTNWPVVQLGDISPSIDYGFTASATQEPMGPKFLRITDIQNGMVNWDTVPYCDQRVNGGVARLSPGDIVFARTGATTGKSFLIKSCPETAIFASYLIRVRPSDDVVPGYLAHFFNTPSYWSQIALGARGAAQVGVNASTLKTLKVPLPPLDEQRRIAAILDAADSLRAKRRAALAKLDQLAQSIFIEMFGDAERQGWPITTVSELASSDNGAIRTGPFGSQLLHSEFVDDGVAVLGIDNVVANEFRWAERRFITEHKYAELKRYTVKPGDVLITIMGTCGRCTVVPDDIPLAINTKHLCCITLDPRKCDPRFLHAYFLLHPLARRYLDQTAKGAIMAGLNMGIIKDMPIAVPPLALQVEFAQRTALLDEFKTRARLSELKLNVLFRSLQHRAFRGEL